MIVYRAQFVADLCELPLTTLMRYVREWPWLAYRDDAREVMPEFEQGLPRLYMPAGFALTVAIIRACYSVGMGTAQVDAVLRSRRWRETISPPTRPGTVAYYPATGEAEIIDLEEAELKLLGEPTARDAEAEALRGYIDQVKGDDEEAARVRADLEAQAAAAERDYTLPRQGVIAILLPVDAMAERLQMRLAQLQPTRADWRVIDPTLYNRIADELAAEFESWRAEG